MICNNVMNVFNQICSMLIYTYESSVKIDATVTFLVCIYAWDILSYYMYILLKEEKVRNGMRASVINSMLWRNLKQETKKYDRSILVNATYSTFVLIAPLYWHQFFFVNGENRRVESTKSKTYKCQSKKCINIFLLRKNWVDAIFQSSKGPCKYSQINFC